MKNLLVISAYRCGAVVYAPGQRLTLAESEADFLLRDSPGSFQVVGAEHQAILDAPKTQVIDLSDGVDDAEATTAGKTLAERKKGKR